MMALKLNMKLKSWYQKRIKPGTMSPTDPALFWCSLKLGTKRKWTLRGDCFFFVKLLFPRSKIGCKMSNNNGGTLCLSGGDACMHTYTHKPLKVIIQSPHTSSMYSHHVRLNSFTQTSALEEPNPQHATPCYQQVVRNLLYFFIAPTNWRWTYVISQQCPSSLLNRPDISLIISGQREASLWAALILAIVPLEFGSRVIFPGLDWRGCVTAPSCCCCCQASTANERPPQSPLEINSKVRISPGRAGQIWGGDGICVMACQVAISVRLYKTSATYLTST